MADLRVEQIMVAVKTAVDGLTTTTTNVDRDRDYPTNQDYSLSVNQGADNVVELQGNVFIDSMLQVSIVAFVKQSTTYSTVMNQIRKEVHIAMMADRKLGLSAFVHDTISIGADVPEVLIGLEKPVVRMPINFEVLYRHSITDASA